MKLTHCLIVLFIKQIAAASLRKPPAFSTPLYSDSYLPATLQVIFHAVEQLRYLQIEEMQQENTTSLVPTTSSHRPGQHHPYLSANTEEGKIITTTKETTKLIDKYDSTIDEKDVDLKQVTPVINHETPEQNEETPEMNYATPETNYEVPEDVQVQSETRNNTETSNEESISLPLTSTQSTMAMNNDVTASIVSKHENKQSKATVENVVQGVYGLIKPTATSTTVIRFDMDSTEKSENKKEEEEEIRFTLLGEKVTQIPRPSLSSALKRDKVPLKPSLEQLALLYDALNKDARKQGFSKYSGYSDEVLKTLESSTGGGAGVQLKTLLEKTLDGNELTRDDAKAKAREAYRDLANQASELSTDLRRLLPLNYVL